MDGAGHSIGGGAGAEPLAAAHLRRAAPAEPDAAGLERLAARVAEELEWLEIPPRAWVPPRRGPDGVPVLDVVVVGAGLSGLAIAFGLIRRRVTNILVIDRAPRGGEGPWLTHARMDTLRSPKTLSGPDAGLPSLTYRAWHEAAFGPASFAAIDKIDRHHFAAYLAWYREVLRLPVRNGHDLRAIEEGGDTLALRVGAPDGERTIRARKVILATGVDGCGRPSVPPAVAALPRGLWWHSADPIAPGALRGRDVAVLGAGASAFDLAVHALRDGARRVVLHARRPVLPRAEVLAWSNFPGFLVAFADLADDERWRFMRLMREKAAPPTQEMFDRAAADGRFELRLGSAVDALAADGDGVTLTVNDRPERADRLLLGTGFSAEMEERPELSALLPRVLRWRDRYAPPDALADPELGAYPYLGGGFELLAREPADAAFLGRIHLFNTGAVPSLGPVCNGVTGLKYGLPRVVDAIARDLFREDAAMHMSRLADFDEPHVDASPERVAAIRSGAVPLAGSRVAVEARAEADRLIALARADSAEFPVVLANHLPMVLEALVRLGATAERLRAYFDHYRAVNRVPPQPPRVAPLGWKTWRDGLGDRSRETDLRDFFTEEAGRLGGGGAIRIYLPDLAPGVSASALHGLMRLAYAVLRVDEAEVGAALGYWAATFLPLRDEPAGPPVTDDPAALLAMMREEPAFREPVDAHLLWHHMRATGGRDAFAPLIGRLAVGPGTLDRLAETALGLYAGTMSFEALHAVTGAHWVRVVAPQVEDPLPLVRAFWQAILALMPKIGLPLPPSPEALAGWRATVPPPDAEIRAAAVASDDEHDHSLVFSALEEARRTGDPLYRVVAARRVGLL